MLRLLLSLLLCLITPAWAAEQLIVEPDQGRQPIIAAINGAKSTVDLAMYGFTDPDLIQAFIQAKDQDKGVRILLQHFPYGSLNENIPAIQLFAAAKVNLAFAPSTFYLLHQKTLIVDHKQALILSFNFTRTSFTKERNFGLITDDAAVVNEIQQVFNADWQNIPVSPQVSRLIWSPDNSRKKILSVINGAKKEIKVYAQGLTDNQVVGALAAAARRGVTVQVLTSGFQNSKKADYLQRAGVQLGLDKKLVIHAKVVIADQNQALLGSINFTKPSMDSNRELSILMQDPKLVAQLVQIFDNDWKDIA